MGVVDVEQRNHRAPRNFQWVDLVPRCFQWVDLQDPLSPKANGSEQTGVPIALKPCTARILGGGNDEIAFDERSPNFRHVSPGNLGF